MLTLVTFEGVAEYSNPYSYHVWEKDIGHYITGVKTLKLQMIDKNTCSYFGKAALMHTDFDTTNEELKNNLFEELSHLSMVLTDNKTIDLGFNEGGLDICKVDRTMIILETLQINLETYWEEKVLPEEVDNEIMNKAFDDLEKARLNCLNKVMGE